VNYGADGTTMYTVPVPTELQSNYIAKALTVAGVGCLFLGWLLYNELNVSTVLILALVFGGFILALVGVVILCRLASKFLRRTLSIVLLAFGAVTSYMALEWGHGAVTLIVLEFPP
jgi:hypothetical protein